LKETAPIFAFTTFLGLFFQTTKMTNEWEPSLKKSEVRVTLNGPKGEGQLTSGVFDLF